MATEAQRTRLDPEVFRLPVDKIREGHYTDAYFNLTRQLLVELGRRPTVTAGWWPSSTSRCRVRLKYASV